MRNIRFPLLLAALPVLSATLFIRSAHALTVTAVTSDNGYPAHEVDWTDADGLPRTAVLVDQNPTTAPYTGFLRRYTYQVGGVTRTCTGTDDFAKGGNLETSGDGFVQNHTADGGDYSSGNGPGVPGTTTITLQGSSHALITFDMPTYTISGKTVPTTVQWFFADGRSHPVYAVSQDARATGGNLGGDSRSPYGDMAYDGDGLDALVGGISWGDTFKFVTLAANPEELTMATGWHDTEANTIPYAMQWAEPATADAEIGHVATLPISLSDQGADTQSYPNIFDPRNKTQLAGPLPAIDTWAYQINNYNLPDNGPTDSKRLTWQTNFGRIGGFDNYGTDGLLVTEYSQHSTDPVDHPLEGTRADGLLMAYSTFIVLGTHTGGYLNGTVGLTVKQMENAARATLTATTGTVATSGPAGIGNASDAKVTYTPAGYNPTYSAWEVTATNNTADVTLTPAVGTTLDRPVFVIDGYAATKVPTVSFNGTDLSSTDYYSTLDTGSQRLWLTVNKTVSSAVDLHVAASTVDATPTPTVSPTPTPTPTPTVSPSPSPTPTPTPNPSAPTVTVAVSGDGQAVEDGEHGKVAVQRTGGTNSALTVSYKVKGSAQAGTDYKTLSGTVTIPVGSAQAKIKIKALDNDTADGARSVKIKLLPSSDGTYKVGTPAGAKVKIIDND